MSYLTAHVLDASTGSPAAGVAVRLETADGTRLASTRTNSDGRVTDLGPDDLEPGPYRVTFGSGDYFASRDVECFYPEVTVLFSVAAGRAHSHIPLLLSPYAYTTYRGS